jgi:hypothetical protein
MGQEIKGHEDDGGIRIHAWERGGKGIENNKHEEITAGRPAEEQN